MSEKMSIQPLVGMTVNAPVGEMTQYGQKLVNGEVTYVSEVTQEMKVRYEDGQTVKYDMSEFGKSLRFVPTGTFPHYEVDQPYYDEIDRLFKSDIDTHVLATYALVADAMSDSGKIASNGKDAAKEYYQSLLKDDAFEQLRWEAAEVLVQCGMGLDYLSW